MSDDENEWEKTQIFLPGAQNKVVPAASSEEENTGTLLRPVRSARAEAAHTGAAHTGADAGARPASVAGAPGPSASSRSGTMVVVVVVVLLAAIAVLGFLLLR